jgi:multiphosphoryl transfer protein
MVGLVLVSHSRALAEAVQRLVRSMTGPELPLAISGGAGEDHQDLGTDAVEILEAIQSVYSVDGVLVLMDMGSAVLSAETALDFLEEAQCPHIKLTSAPFIEGAVAAGVSAKLGNALGDVTAEAVGALAQKSEHLNEESEPAAVPPTQTAPVAQGPSVRVVIPNPQGIHARPAARLAQEAGKYKADVRLRNLTAGKGPAVARSLTSLITLGARQGHEVEIIASGPQEREALDGLKKFIEAGMGDSLNEKFAEVETSKTATSAAEGPTHAMGISSGIGVGRLFFAAESSVSIPDAIAEDVAAETARLHEALQQTRKQMQADTAALSRQIGKSKAEIFVAQMLVLDDPALTERAGQLIAEEKNNAARAWWQTIQEAVTVYNNLEDELLRQRAADLKDVGLAVLRQLGCGASDRIELPEPGIVVARDLTPGQVTQLDGEKVCGVICLEGGRTSHSAILLRSRGIPAVAQAQGVLQSVDFNAAPVLAVINGESGEITLNPDKAALESVETELAAQKARAAQEKAESGQPAITKDGRRIEVFANVGSLADAEAAAANGADGIGLLRTEFLFMDRAEAPNEEEQYISLRDIVRAMGGKPVIVRTLDAGGDKNIPYLDLPKEENPFLGVRAIRLCLRRPELFQTQLRAILRAALEGDLRVMFPMIAAESELVSAKTALAQAHASLAAQNVPHRWPVPVGMMMEVPSAALVADKFAAQVEFFSIGTNDLTQYTLAVDRGNTALQDLSDTLNPAVVSLIETIAKAAHARQIPVAVCGEAAADQKVAAILLDLGVTELSMNPRSIPGAKHWIRQR